MLKTCRRKLEPFSKLLQMLFSADMHNNLVLVNMIAPTKSTCLVYYAICCYENITYEICMYYVIKVVMNDVFF